MAKKEEGGQSAGGGEVRLPSADELRALPKWANVALAARIARRVQPLFDWGWPRAPEKYVIAIDSTIEFSEWCAANAVYGADVRVSERDSGYAKNALEAVKIAFQAADAARTAADHTAAAVYAAKAACSAYTAEATIAAADAVAAVRHNSAWHDSMLRAIQHDLALLRAAIALGKWTDKTPVQPTFFGQLWHRGEPEGWPGTAPKTGIPSEDELSQIPRWARVAFAARCARRVAPLAAEIESTEHYAAMRRAIEHSENAAAAGIRADVPALASEMRRAADTVGLRPALGAVDAAHCAILEAMVDPARLSEYRNYVHSAARGAQFAFEHGNLAWIEPGARAMRRDFELLKATSETERWTDETPVPPEFFGAVWPAPWGTPEGWDANRPQVPPPRQELLLEFAVPDDTPAHEVDRLVREFVRKASELHVMAGGSGLKVDALHIWSPATVEAEVQP